MSYTIIPRDLVAQKFSISTSVLVRYESLGLIRPVSDGAVTGYEPAQIRRLWSIVTYQRDLGVNLAGVEVILHLFDHMADVQRKLDRFALDLNELLETDASSGGAERAADDEAS